LSICSVVFCTRVRLFAVEHSLTQGGSKILIEARETPKSEYIKKIGQTGGAKVTSREGNSPDRSLRFLKRVSKCRRLVLCCLLLTARLGSSHALRKALKLME